MTGAGRRLQASIVCLGLLGLFGLCWPTLTEAHLALDAQLQDTTRRIEKDPSNARLYLKRGEQHRERGAWKPALEDFRRAEALEPGLPEVQLSLARLYVETGRYTEGGTAVERYLRARPQDPEGWALHARAAAGMGRPLEAARDYDHLIALHTGAVNPRPEYYLDRSRVLASAGSKHLGRAVRGLDQGMARLGPVPGLELEAIALECRCGRYDAALKRIDVAMSRASRRENWLRRRGAVLEQAGRAPEARVAYLEALAAIDALPTSRRETPAMRELEIELKGRIEALARMVSAPKPGRSVGPDPIRLTTRPDASSPGVERSPPNKEKDP